LKTLLLDEQVRYGKTVIETAIFLGI